MLCIIPKSSSMPLSFCFQAMKHRYDKLVIKGMEEVLNEQRRKEKAEEERQKQKERESFLRLAMIHLRLGG